jgi:hypothetical protein
MKHSISSSSNYPARGKAPLNPPGPAHAARLFAAGFLIALGGLAALAPAALAAPAGGPEEPVRYVGHDQADPNHEGGLRLAVGAKSWQAFRANRAHPEQAEDSGWTYNHAPMIAHWNNRFWLQYLSGPVHENKGHGQTLILSSPDGITWDKPQVAFPPYRMPDGTLAMPHQRMGWFVAPNGRLLTLGFFGIPNHPNDGSGVGRLVREVYRDGALGPIHFIRYNRHNGWNEQNTTHPSYTASTDAGFKEACAALLAHKLVTLQWWEEDRAKDGFYPDLGGAVLKAFSWYSRPDGAIVGLWKSAFTALSRDGGATWSKPVKAPTLVMAEAKVWGQRTPDGRYALLYNPRRDNRHRWPLAVVTGEDGIHFDNLLTVQGEVAPRRYDGLDKAYGPQYVRGIVDGNGTPPGQAFWVTYSMNKDDLWVSRIPTPVRGTVTGPISDRFDTGAFEDLPWNTYSPRWAQVRIADFPSATNRSLELRDADPADYARAVRVLPEMKHGTIRFKLLAKQHDRGRLEIELHDRFGYRPPIRIFFDDQRRVQAMDGNRSGMQNLTRYVANVWYDVAIRFDVEKELFAVTIDHMPVLVDAEILDPVASLERISFRTGPFRTSPTLRDPKTPGEDFPGGDEPVPAAVYHIDDLTVDPSPVPFAEKRKSDGTTNTTAPK